jgi:hypothetical protein
MEKATGLEEPAQTRADSAERTTDRVRRDVGKERLDPPRRGLLRLHDFGSQLANTLSAWLTGKRRPGAAGLMAIDRVYGISPRQLDLPPADFAQLLADRERMAEAEENLRVYLGGKPEHVVPLKRRKR